ncbi:MAG: S-layer homology domain-containing protein [Anaeromyxobacter sp.]
MVEFYIKNCDLFLEVKNMIKHKGIKLNKLLSLFLALVLMLSLLPVTSLAASYNDTETHWASSAINKWSSLGVLQGYDGKFRPDAPITRGEMAVILDRIMDYQTAAKNDFSDLEQDFYTDAVLKANAAGVMLGNNGEVRPTDNITREDAIVMLGRALEIEESTAALSFADAGLVSSYAKGYVTALAAKGYINGYHGSFNPKSAISRAEVVTILNNAICGIFIEAKEYTGTYAGVVVVNKSGATLKDTVINGDLIIAEGVGNGDVMLDNVKVTGNTIVRGGGENSIHIEGGSYASLIIEKTDDGKVRVVTSDGAVVNAVYVDDGNDGVILSGSFGNVTMNAKVNVVIDSGSNVATLTVAVSGVTVTNNGSIGTLNVNADGIVVGGNKPYAVNVGSGVKTPPVDGNGNPLKGNNASTTGGTGGGGGGGGDDAQDQTAPSASLFTATAPSAQGASDGSIAISDITGLQFSTDGTSYTTVTASPITGLASGNYYFRYSAKTGYNASPATTVTVPAGSSAPDNQDQAGAKRKPVHGHRPIGAGGVGRLHCHLQYYRASIQR